MNKPSHRISHGLLLFVLCLGFSGLQNPGYSTSEYAYDRGKRLPETLDHLLKRANEFYLQGDYSNALTNFLFAREIDPMLHRSFNFNFKVGYSYRALKQHELAIEYFKMASSASSMNDYVLYHLGEEFHSAGYDTLAINAFEKVIRNYPESIFQVEALFKRIEILNQQQEYEAAIGDLETLKTKVYSSKYYKRQYEPAFLLWNGITRFNHGSYTRALKLFKILIDDFAYGDEALIAKGYYEQAMKELGRFLNVQDFLDNNRVLVKQGHYQEALNELAHARSIYLNRESQIKIEFAIARTYEWQELFEAAQPRYRNLWNKYQHKESLLRLAYVSRYMKDITSSTDAFKRSLQLDRKGARWQNYLEYHIANNYAALGDSNNLYVSQEYYRQLQSKLSIQSYYGVRAAFREGFIDYKLGNYYSAIRKFESTAKQTSKLQNQCFYWLAKSYERVGNKNAAQRIYLKLAEDKFYDYYGMLGHIKTKEDWRNTFRPLYYARNGDLPSKPESYITRLDETLKYYFTLDKEKPLITADDALLSKLDPAFKRAIIAKEILPPSYAEKELFRVKKQYYQSFSRSQFFKNFAEYVGATNLAMDTRVWLRTRHEKSYNSELELAKLFFPKYYDHSVSRYAMIYNFDKNLIWSVIKQESAFRSNVISSARAIGLMQIMPFTGKVIASDLNLRNFKMIDLMEPERSIQMGSYYLNQQANKFNNYIPAILGAYNAGPHRVQFWIHFHDETEPEQFVEMVDIPETEYYVRKILHNRWMYYYFDNS